MPDLTNAWRRFGSKKRSGVLSPLFSVWSSKSVGIGDFADLKLLIDWSQKTGNSILQLLPLNETGPLSCPYDSVSSFALEPAYISLSDIPAAKDKKISGRIESLRRKFPCRGKCVDYRIKEGKLALLKEIFNAQPDAGDKDLKKFRGENSYWLEGFARGDTDFYIWVQWQLFKQLKSAKSYANEKGVFLMGDLPVLVSRDSDDCRQHPEFFKFQYAAGAPPDMYCAKGQRWGMPTYDWEKIAQDGFIYLKEKLRYARNFYDILRIDHVVGLFRIWSIPYDDPLENQGLNGFFDPPDRSVWEEHGSRILTEALKSTDMLLCAEDLGVIPKECTDTLERFAIPGNDVQRWAKDWKARHDFLSADEYRRLCVGMLSTHDTTNWAAWWENEAGTVDEELFKRRCNERGIEFNRVSIELFDYKRSKHARLRWKESIDSTDRLILILGKPREQAGDFIDFYENSFREKEKLWKLFNLPGKMREACNEEISRSALKFILKSNAVFCVNTIIDWLYMGGLFPGDPYKYRINTPGAIGPHNWSLRLPASLEELAGHKLSKDIFKEIKTSGRSI